MIYEYQCETCKYEFSIERRITEEESTTKCPNCGSDKTQRLISNNYFILKGDGWGKDGY